MKRFSLLIAAVVGLGCGVIASADNAQQGWQLVETTSVLRWRYEPMTAESALATVTSPEDAHPYAINESHPQHPANQDRIYHRAVVLTLPESDTVKIGYEVIWNPNPVHQL